MTDPAVFWPASLGLFILIAGIISYRRDLHVSTSREAFGLVALGPVFVAASIAAFAGEHFTIAASIAQLVPKWMPGRLLIAYFVGVAHLAAAVSFVARRYIRWSAIGLALMFAMFVLLMDLPGAIAHPTKLISWILAARQTTFSLGALALFATEVRADRPHLARTISTVARIWTAFVLVFYGLEHLANPQYAPGVPSTALTAAWIPLPHVIAYATGILLVAFGITMFIEKYASASAARSGLLMTLLTLVLYVPQFFIASGVPELVTAINFIFDTLLFAGTMFVISRAISETGPRVVRALDSRP